MFQLILPYKKNTVDCTILNIKDWQLLQPLFTPSTRERFALKSIYTFATQNLSNQLISKHTLQQALEHRWLLLSLLEETIGNEATSASINCLNAICWHKRTTYSLLLLLSKAKMPNRITISQLHNLLSLLGVTVITSKAVKTNGRETLAFQQKDQYQIRQVQYTHFGYRLV